MRQEEEGVARVLRHVIFTLSGEDERPASVEGSSSPNDSLRGRAGGLESAFLTSHLRRGGAAASANAASNATMGGVSKNATASPKTKVRPSLFPRRQPREARHSEPADASTTLLFFLAEKPRRFLTTQSAVAGGHAPARHAARDPAPSEPATKVRRASRVPPLRFPVAASRDRASPALFFHRRLTRSRPPSGKATTNLGTGDARARGDVRAPARSARARGFWVPEPTRAQHPRGRGRVDRPGAARPQPVGPRAQVAAKYPRAGARPGRKPGPPEPEPGPGLGRASLASRAGAGGRARPDALAGETVRCRRAIEHPRGHLRPRVAVVQPLRPHNDSHAFRPAPFSTSRIIIISLHRVRKTAPRRRSTRRGRVPRDAPAAQRAPPREFAGARSPGGGAARAGQRTGIRAVRSRLPAPRLLRRARGFPLGLPADAAVPGSGAAGTTTTGTTAETTTISPSTAAALEGRDADPPASAQSCLRPSASPLARRAISPRRRVALSPTTCSAECRR